MPSHPRFLRRIQIRNFKSIGQCDVALGSFTLIVGRNGAGKSNFLDALRFVADGLQTTLDQAIRVRGGIDAVRRRSTGHPRNFAIGIEAELPDQHLASYTFGVTAKERGGFAIREEKAEVAGSPGGHFHTQGGKLLGASIPNMPEVASDRLYLVQASGFPAFRPLYDTLSAMGFYNLNPEAMKELQSPDAGELLHRDGGNIAGVIGRLAQDKPEALDRLKAYLATIVPEVSDVERVSLGPRETLLFKQRVAGAESPWKFYAGSMSDGTLRSLGNLVAVTQLVDREVPVSLVGLEEPETALHPAAAGALIDALREAAAHTQVILTTHSPDLLDKVDLEQETVLVATAAGGKTSLAPIDEASREAIRQELFSPGELLRLDQLSPDENDLTRQRQMKLFVFDDEGDDT